MSSVTQNGGALSATITNLYYENSVASEAGAATGEQIWFAVQTRSRHEKKVNSALLEKGIESFLPLHREKRRWSDRHQWVELPLFTQYLFVRMPSSAQTRALVLQTPGVLQFVGISGRGIPIPNEQIESLQAILAQRIPVLPHEFLKVGKRVRIRGGALDGIEGVLSAIRNDKSLVVSVDLIQKSVAIQIEGYQIDPV